MPGTVAGSFSPEVRDKRSDDRQPFDRLSPGWQPAAKKGRVINKSACSLLTLLVLQLFHQRPIFFMDHLFVEFPEFLKHSVLFFLTEIPFG
jgi:hypothetical protein